MKIYRIITILLVVVVIMVWYSLYHSSYGRDEKCQYVEITDIDILNQKIYFLSDTKEKEFVNYSDKDKNELTKIVNSRKQPYMILCNDWENGVHILWSDSI